mmetsp:Transcript_41662/g.67039  ORF Transcript_41662/g.67039 Transcript_41662/m.67039 type:complete len:88 (-) Transcript_41662:104-367(-)
MRGLNLIVASLLSSYFVMKSKLGKHLHQSAIGNVVDDGARQTSFQLLEHLRNILVETCVARSKHMTIDERAVHMSESFHCQMQCMHM